MKKPEELKALKEELEALDAKLAELSEEELEQVAGGRALRRAPIFAGDNIHIKGNRSLSASNNPLIIVDGLPVSENN